MTIQVAANGATLYETVWGRGPRPQQVRRGNVYVFYPAVDSRAVRVALAELH